jgi:AraC-like DNA-binding protein
VIPEHFHPEDQLVFASRGVMTVKTRATLWVVPTLRAVWIPAKTPHSVAMSGPVSMRTLYLKPGLVRGFAAQCVVINVSSLLRELILHACRFPLLSRNVATERRILEMLVDQFKSAHTLALRLPQPTDARAERVVRLLLAEPGTRASLGELCVRSGASKRTIQRIFIAETNLTFDKWRRQLRLLHALEEIASGGKITTAALESGYESPSAFIAMFKKQFGATPRQYFQRAVA